MQSYQVHGVIASTSMRQFSSALSLQVIFRVNKSTSKLKRFLIYQCLKCFRPRSMWDLIAGDSICCVNYSVWKFHLIRLERSFDCLRRARQPTQKFHYFRTSFGQTAKNSVRWKSDAKWNIENCYQLRRGKIWRRWCQSHLQCNRYARLSFVKSLNQKVIMNVRT